MLKYLFCCYSNKRRSIVTPVYVKEYNNESFNTYIPLNLNPRKIEKFIPIIKIARVIKVYDGDTITIASYYPSHKERKLYKFSVRLSGIDCPEMRGASSTERKTAVIAKDFLHDLLYNQLVQLNNISLDKYGRLLADVKLGDISCSELLIEKRLAVKYNGKKKKTPSNWLHYFKYGITETIPIDTI
jgi:endonuclease YncB( thermonuclease family)